MKRHTHVCIHAQAHVESNVRTHDQAHAHIESPSTYSFHCSLSGTSARHVSMKVSTSTRHASTRANSSLRRTATNDLEYRKKPWVYRPQKHGLCLVSTFKSQPSYGFGRSKRPCNEPREGTHVSENSIFGDQGSLVRSHMRLLMGVEML